MSRLVNASAAVLALVFGLASSACDAPAAEEHHLTLDLVNGSPGCLGPQILTIRSILVQAIGEDEGGSACLLAASACLPIGDNGITSLDGLERVLADAPQPVLDVELDRTLHLRVLGYKNGTCDAMPRMCGVADPPANTATLAVPMTCELGETSDRCGSADLPTCAP